MLLIIPGWMNSSRDWSAVTDMLDRQGVPYHFIDLPGFGVRPADASITTFADLCTFCSDEITPLVRDCDEEPVTLFGHSCGGRIALQLVAEGLSVDHLILSGSPNLYRPTLTVRTITKLSSLAQPFKHLFPESLLRRLRSADYEQVKGTELAALYASVISDDQTDQVSRVTTPTTLLWGENDDAAPLHIAHELHSLLPHSTLDVLPGLGHNLHLENPRLVAGRLASFIKYETS